VVIGMCSGSSNGCSVCGFQQEKSSATQGRPCQWLHTHSPTCAIGVLGFMQGATLPHHGSLLVPQAARNGHALQRPLCDGAAVRPGQREASEGHP
jgi:hypothetical protein